jgi:hypothetical protein
LFARHIQGASAAAAILPPVTGTITGKNGTTAHYSLDQCGAYDEIYTKSLTANVPAPILFDASLKGIYHQFDRYPHSPNTAGGNQSDWRQHDQPDSCFRRSLRLGGKGSQCNGWLLKRDVDPASNDNDPMWLQKAA